MAAGFDTTKKGPGLQFDIIDIRQFAAADFASVLAAEAKAWETGLRWNYHSAVQLISNCLDEKRLSGYALVTNKRIEGYSFFFYDGPKALIGDLFVAPGAGGVEQAVVLLEHVLETLLATPGISRLEAQIPHYRLEDLDPIFRSCGSQGYLRRFMAAPLVGCTDDHPTATRAPGKQADDPQPGNDPATDFVFEPWERKYHRQAAHLICHAYSHHVDALINNQYASLDGSGRLIETITEHSGCGDYLEGESAVAIHRATRKLAAALAVTRVRPRTAHIPQIAVGREFQGRGLGTAMLQRAFASLARHRFEEVTLTVTDLNAGAVRLYERLGFRTFRTFGAFVWQQQW